MISCSLVYFIFYKFRVLLFMQLTQITRTGQCSWESKNILAVSFAPLVQQSRADGEKPDTVELRKFSGLNKTKPNQTSVFYSNWSWSVEQAIFKKWCDETTPTAIFALTYEARPAAAPKSQLLPFLEIMRRSPLFDGLTCLCWPSWRTGGDI